MAGTSSSSWQLLACTRCSQVYWTRNWSAFTWALIGSSTALITCTAVTREPVHASVTACADGSAAVLAASSSWALLLVEVETFLFQVVCGVHCAAPTVSKLAQHLRDLQSRSGSPPQLRAAS